MNNFIFNEDVSLVFTDETFYAIYQDFINIPGKVTKGDSAAYYCNESMKLVVSVSNIRNTDTTYAMYYKDGKIYDDDFLPSHLKNSQEDLLTVFKEVLTQEEWKKLKEIKGTYFLLFNITADTSGKPKEIIFKFRKTDPVMMYMSPDRLYKLEKRLKEVMGLIPCKDFSLFKNIKYLDAIDYKNIAPFDEKN